MKILDEVIVTVIATGFDKGKKQAPVVDNSYVANTVQQPARRTPPRDDFSFQPEILTDNSDGDSSTGGSVDIEMPSFLRDRNF